jgi:hypothetical protein
MSVFRLDKRAYLASEVSVFRADTRKYLVSKMFVLRADTRKYLVSKMSVFRADTRKYLANKVSVFCPILTNTVMFLHIIEKKILKCIISWNEFTGSRTVRSTFRQIWKCEQARFCNVSLRTRQQKTNTVPPSAEQCTGPELREKDTKNNGNSCSAYW